MISIKNADKYFNRKKASEIHVINDLTLELPETGFIAITGRSGCGKTTLLNAIGGLDDIGNGSIEVCGKDISKDTDNVRNRYIGYILQNYCLCASMTVGENVMSALRLAGFTDKAESEKRVFTALKNVGMEKFIKRYPNALSGGQQQRVAIARAIVKNPAVILADEPTGNLDSANTLTVMEILKEISKNRLVLMVTHEEDLAYKYCDRIITLSDGRIVSDTTADPDSVRNLKETDDGSVYLGDMEHSSLTLGKLKIEYFSDGSEKEAELKIISHKGNVYLGSSGASVRLIGEKNSLNIVDGKKPKENDDTLSHKKFDISALPPVPESKNTGRLFDLKKAAITAFRNNLSPKNRKVKMLYILMICLSLVMTGTSAFWGRTLSGFKKIERSYSDRIVFFNLTDEENEFNYSEISSLTGKNGVTSVFPLKFFSKTDMTYAGKTTVVFKYGSFDSKNDLGFSFGTTGFFLPQTEIRDSHLLAGTDKITADNQVVITSAIADSIIENSYYDNISSYDELIGLRESVNEDNYFTSSTENICLEIVGIVSENKPYYFVSELQYAYRHLEIIALPYSFLKNPTFPAPTDGSAIVNISSSFVANDSDFTGFQKSKISILGKPLDIAGRAFSYRETVEECMLNHGYRETKTDKEWEAFLQNVMPDQDPALIRSYLPLAKMIYRLEFANIYKDYLSDKTYKIHTPASYYVMKDGEFDKDSYIRMIVSSAGSDEITPVYSEDPETLYALAYLFYKTYDRYPAINGFTDQAGNVIKKDTLWLNFSQASSNSDKAIQQYLPQSDPQPEYQSYFDSLNAEYCVDSGENTVAILSDNDYMSLLMSDGATFSPVGFHSKHQAVAIVSDDPDTTVAYLKSVYGSECICSPDMIENQIKVELFEQLVAQTIPFAILSVILGISIYFIMRTALMSRVKEIAVYRVIGVRKSNLYFLFFTESLSVFSFTVFPGYFIVSIFLGYVSSPLTTDVFYYSFYTALFTFTYLFACVILFGILPVIRLLRKTPSQLLTKYDI